MFDLLALYDLIESKKSLPNKDELFNLFFVAIIELEEFDFASARKLLGMSNSDFYYLRNKLMPEFQRKHKDKLKRKKGRVQE